MEFQKLMIAEDGTITIEQKRFLDLHKEILYSGNLAADFALKMAEKLKQMKDLELYRVAGFENFRDYVEIALGIKTRQAYNYIKVYQEFPKEFLQSNAKIGITKLVLLASVPEDERNQVVEEVNLESVSVKKLKERIQELENQSEQMKINLESDLTLKYDAEKEKIEKVSKDNAEKVSKLENEKVKLQSEIDKLKKSLEKSKVVEKVNDPEMVNELQKAKEELQSLEQKMKVKTTIIESMKKELLASDGVMSKIKVKFEDLQRIGNDMMDLLKQLDDDKCSKCKSAIKTIVGGWNL
jgi:hypothetical protein